jgi:hypothetical protein
MWIAAVFDDETRPLFTTWERSAARAGSQAAGTGRTAGEPAIDARELIAARLAPKGLHAIAQGNALGW